MSVLEFENNSSPVWFLLLNSIPKYSSSIKRRFLSLFMKINFTANEFLSFAFVQLPPPAFPYIIVQLDKIILLLDYVYIHFVFSFFEKWYLSYPCF